MQKGIQCTFHNSITGFLEFSTMSVLYKQIEERPFTLWIIHLYILNCRFVQIEERPSSAPCRVTLRSRCHLSISLHSPPNNWHKINKIQLTQITKTIDTKQNKKCSEDVSCIFGLFSNHLCWRICMFGSEWQKTWWTHVEQYKWKSSYTCLDHMCCQLP